ncbi:PREDICTED: SPRY domain-containing protein 7 [Dipodomys ordii]|uniref:SPRY domain-containing protein 7 n=1 Tax=Dipodomys ordii TaxID=10020 RepID=A0A1S3GPT5_DIPOR|nr:PREDICTED: SPRY domain-containing protein 7 [Dipodomys ordii]
MSGIWGIGVATQKVNLNQIPLGRDVHSLVMRNDGALYHNNEEKNRLPANSLPQEGDVVRGGRAHGHPKGCRVRRRTPFPARQPRLLRAVTPLVPPTSLSGRALRSTASPRPDVPGPALRLPAPGVAVPVGAGAREGAGGGVERWGGGVVATTKGRRQLGSPGAMAASVFCCLRCCRDGGTGHIPLKEMPAVQLDTQHMGKGLPSPPRPQRPAEAGPGVPGARRGVGRMSRAVGRRRLDALGFPLADSTWSGFCVQGCAAGGRGRRRERGGVDDSAILDCQFSEFYHTPPPGFEKILFEQQIF